MTEEDLLHLAQEWVLKQAGCGFSMKGNTPVPAPVGGPFVFGVASFGKSVYVEVVLTKEAFQHEMQRFGYQDPAREIGKFRFICAPAGVVTERELPLHWGLLCVHEKGNLTCEHNPYDHHGINYWQNGFQNYDPTTEQLLMRSLCPRMLYRGVVHSLSFTGSSFK